MAKEDEFDILTFFIYVMILLTTIVGGFAAWNHTKVSKEARKIRAELQNLRNMEKMAKNPEFKGWVSQDRDGGKKIGKVPDFKQLYINTARQNRLRLESHRQEGEITHRNGVELPFRLIINQCRIEQLVKFMATIEDRWPGARVRRIVKLNFTKKKRQGTEGWDAVFVLSIFRAN